MFKYKNKVNFSWLSSFARYENTITTIDIGVTDRGKVNEDVAQSMDEQMSRFYDARYSHEKYDAERVYHQLRTINHLIAESGELLKRVHIRLYVYERTKEQLEERIGKIVAELESSNYHAAIFIGENEYEWKSLMLSVTQQDKLLNARYGATIPSGTLAQGHPFHFSSLSDPNGTYWGYTRTNGTVFFDPYHKDKLRMSYCAIYTGRMGSGKSTAMKFRTEKDCILGNYVRGFVTNIEYDKLIRRYGGTIINLDGSEGRINILHVYKTADTETASFINHINRVCRWYGFMNPDAEHEDFMLLNDLLRIFYCKKMGYDLVSEQKNNSSCITGKSPEEYPVLRELYVFLQKLIYKDIPSRTKDEQISESHFKKFQSLELTLNNAVKTYGQIFDGHSSIRSFENEQIVYFNIAGLTGMDEQVFDAQMHSAYSLLWENMYYVGAPQKEKYDNGEITADQIKYFFVSMDECHHFVNARKIESVKMLDMFARESRKYFAGISLATQQVSDFYPKGSTSDGIEAMNNLFSLSQYRFFFQQPEDSIPLIREIIGDDIPGQDMLDMKKFQQGECILNIAGVSSIRFNLDVSEEELALYAGGA